MCVSVSVSERFAGSSTVCEADWQQADPPSDRAYANHLSPVLSEVSRPQHASPSNILTDKSSICEPNAMLEGDVRTGTDFSDNTLEDSISIAKSEMCDYLQGQQLS